MLPLRTLALALTCLVLVPGCVLDPTEVLVTLNTDAPPDQLLVITATVRAGGATDGPGETHVWRRGGGSVAGDGGTDGGARGPDGGLDSGVHGTDGGMTLGDGGRTDGGADANGPVISLPASFAVTPGSGARDGSATLVVDAVLYPRRPTDAIIEFRRVARFSFTPQSKTVLPIFLSVACGASTVGCAGSPCTVSRLCEERMQTCGDHGSCVARSVDPTSTDGDAAFDAVRTDINPDAPCAAPCNDAPHARGVCRAGSCELSCDPGYYDCNAQPGDGCEAQIDTDPSNCGACGTRCDSGKVCAQGSCVAGCPHGQTLCGRACVDLNTSADNCGACNSACPTIPHSIPTCTGGRCATACAPGFADCDMTVMGCETNTGADPTNCGMCGHMCPAGTRGTPLCVNNQCALGCAPGYGDCDHAVANGCETVLATTLTACGACGVVCPTPANATPTCSAGVCSFVCATGFADCDGDPTTGCEADLRNDPSHCGTCGNACATRANSAPVCSGGTCGLSCATGYGDCDAMAANGCETDLRTTVAHCGTCANACPPPMSGTATCSGGSCGLSCSMGFADCDTNASNGCEANLSTDPNDCGVCGHRCSFPNTMAGCAGATCTLGTCLGGYYDVDGNPTNGCECADDQNSVSCDGPTFLGSLGVGGTASSVLSKIPGAGAGGDWFLVSFPINADFAQHGTGTPHITFAVNEGDAFRFEIRIGDCGQGVQCGSLANDWSFVDDQCGGAGGTNCTTRNNGWPTTVLIHVVRTTPGQSCANYQLAVAR